MSTALGALSSQWGGIRAQDDGGAKKRERERERDLFVQFSLVPVDMEFGFAAVITRPASKAMDTKFWWISCRLTSAILGSATNGADGERLGCMYV